MNDSLLHEITRRIWGALSSPSFRVSLTSYIPMLYTSTTTERQTSMTTSTQLIGAFLIGASFLALVISAFVQAWYAR